MKARQTRPQEIGGDAVAADDCDIAPKNDGSLQKDIANLKSAIGAARTVFPMARIKAPVYRQDQIKPFEVEQIEQLLVAARKMATSRKMGISDATFYVW